MSMFADHFWGEKHSGFEILSQNLKHGEQACKDLEDFVKQCSVMEETHVKSLGRVLKNVVAYSTTSSFSPVWQAVKASIEKLSAAHNDLSKKWKELSTDIHKYVESLGKKYKTIKDGQAATQETVHSMQSIALHLSKSKEAYNSKFNDYKKALTDKPTIKKIEKAESDFKKATEEYKSNVTKYNTILEDFKKKMAESTELYQENEVEYLSQTDQFARKYASIRDDKHTEIGELHYEFHQSLTELSVECLLDTFIETKGTGNDPPVPVIFEEADIASLPPPPSPQEEGSVEEKEVTTPNTSTSSMMHLNLNVKGLFKRKKKKGQETGKDNDSNHDADSMDKVSNTSSAPEVDEDGFTIRKDNKKEDDSWDSSSGSDSDSDDRRHSKLKVAIRPLDGASAAPPLFGAQKNHIHGGDNNNTAAAGGGDTTGDLVDLLGGLSPRSSGIGDPGSRGTTPISWNNVPSTDTNLTAEDKEVFDTWKTTSNSTLQPAIQSPAIPGLPRPPSRKDIANTNSGRLSAGRYSPMSGMLTRNNDSFSKQSVQTFSANHTSQETIPIAIALTENIKSKFRGSEHESQVIGEVMMSFPAEVLTRDNIPKLSFRIAGRSTEQVKVHTELISSIGDIHTFNEKALLAHLKMKQSKEPNAKHFNIEIARYTLTVTALPLLPVAYWKCEPTTTDLRLEYEYVGSALSKPLPLTHVQFLVPVNGGVTHTQSVPEGVWSPQHDKLLWKIPELKSGMNSKGNLKARFSLGAGPSTPASVAVQFLCDDTILSGTQFELATKQYRVSFTKKRMVAKFLVDTDKLVTYV